MADNKQLGNGDDGPQAKVADPRSDDWGDDLDTFAPPLHWPSIPSVDYPVEMDSLRRWVKQLVERFEHLDTTVIPACWSLHNGHVEALAALRDHERGAYTESSPSKDGVDWHRALALIEARLREWTGWLGCASGHREPIRTTRTIDPDEWDKHVQQEQRRRQRRELAAGTPD
jgi:hypothetical protein